MPLSPNRLLRMHWRERTRYNRGWDAEVMVAKNRAKIWGRPRYGSVSLLFEIQFTGRKEMDPDNRIAACKPIIDALIDNGLIYDDAPKYVRGVDAVEIRVPRNSCGTTVLIYPA